MPRGGHGGVSIGEAGGHGSNTSGNHNSDRSGSSSRGLGERPLGKFTFHGERDRELKRDRDREMVGGCCVCSDERGWDEKHLSYCTNSKNAIPHSDHRREPPPAWESRPRVQGAETLKEK